MKNWKGCRDKQVGDTCDRRCKIPDTHNIEVIGENKIESERYLPT